MEKKKKIKKTKEAKPKTREQTIYFCNLELDKLESEKKITLTDIIQKYTKDLMGVEQKIIKEEKGIRLLEVNNENDFIHLKFEIMRYGETKDIKEVETFSKVSTLAKNQYVEELQYITLKKNNDNSYDVAIQSRQIGINYIKFYNILYKFYTDNKKYFEDLYKQDFSGTALRVHAYRTADFFSKLENFMPNFIKITSNNPREDISDNDIKFSDKTTYKAKVEFTIREKRGFIQFFDKNVTLKDFIRKKLEEYPDGKITIKGENGSGEKGKIFSSDVDYNSTVKIEINSDGKLNEDDVYSKLKISIEKLTGEGYTKIIKM